MVRKLMVVGLVATSLLVTACNTIGGMGRDLESVGETVSDAAR